VKYWTAGLAEGYFYPIEIPISYVRFWPQRWQKDFFAKYRKMGHILPLHWTFVRKGFQRHRNFAHLDPWLWTFLVYSLNPYGSYAPQHWCRQLWGTGNMPLIFQECRPIFQFILERHSLTATVWLSPNVYSMWRGMVAILILFIVLFCIIFLCGKLFLKKIILCLLCHTKSWWRHCPQSPDIGM